MSSENETKLSRRRFIGGASAVVVTVGCGLGDKNKPNKGGGGKSTPQPKSFEESLVYLVGILGPWPDDQAEQVKDFSQRFMANEGRMKALKEHEASIKTLADKLVAPQGKKLDEVDLGSLSEAEGKALDTVLEQLYSVEEVRFVAVGEPPSGTCIGNADFVSKVPS